MEELIISVESCKACKYCISNCPKQALSLSNSINTKGYRPVQVNAEKCICCGICYTVCPDYVFEIREKGV